MSIQDYPDETRRLLDPNQDDLLDTIPIQKTFHEIIFVSIPIFRWDEEHLTLLFPVLRRHSGLACLSALQYEVKMMLKIDPDSKENFIFQAAVAMVYAGVLLFRLGHYIVFMPFDPRTRVVSLTHLLFNVKNIVYKEYRANEECACRIIFSTRWRDFAWLFWKSTKFASFKTCLETNRNLSNKIGQTNGDDEYRDPFPGKSSDSDIVKHLSREYVIGKFPGKFSTNTIDFIDECRNKSSKRANNILISILHFLFPNFFSQKINFSKLLTDRWAAAVTIMHDVIYNDVRIYVLFLAGKYTVGGVVHNLFCWGCRSRWEIYNAVFCELFRYLSKE